MSDGRLEKIIVSTGLGRLRQRSSFDDNILPEIMKELSFITGQKPLITRARKSIAGFKIREGDIVGLKVTLRGNKMKDFFSRFVNTTIPRIRDFRGIDYKNIDSQGNLTMGIKEHIVFPEVNQDETKIDFGLEITLVSNLKNREESYDFFKKLGVPLKEKK